MRYIFIIIIGVSFSMDDIMYKELLSTLQNNIGWNEIKKMDDGSSIKSKKIINMNLAAILIEREVNISPKIIQDILKDILNYNKVLKSSGSLKTKLFIKNKNYLDGYQFIESGIPFISNRKYCFRMFYSDYSINNTILMEWYLLNNKDKYESFLSQHGLDAVYLDYGAGSWMVQEIDQETYLFSYRLFMDPGGYIPDIIIDKVNEISIYNIFNDVIIEAKNRE